MAKEREEECDREEPPPWPDSVAPCGSEPQRPPPEDEPNAGRVLVEVGVVLAGGVEGVEGVGGVRRWGVSSPPSALASLLWL